MIVFQVSLNFQSSERNIENTMSEYNVTIKSFAPPLTISVWAWTEINVW